jgi:Bacterial Ig-like domain
MSAGTAIRATGTAALFASALAVVVGVSPVAHPQKPDPSSRGGIHERDGQVHARFDLSNPHTGPFPSDYFTVADAGNDTGRRLNLPYPDCGFYKSDCQDLETVNTLDGFGLQTRISIPFDGPIDPASASSQTVFSIGLPSTFAGGSEGGSIVGINQIVWDSTTVTLHVESDALLEQHQRYALIVTRGVLDTTGKPVQASEAFRHLSPDVPLWYRHQLLEALHAASRLGVKKQDVVAASVYTTQSVTSVMERIRDRI